MVALQAILNEIASFFFFLREMRLPLRGLAFHQRVLLISTVPYSSKDELHRI